MGGTRCRPDLTSFEERCLSLARALYPAAERKTPVSGIWLAGSRLQGVRQRILFSNKFAPAVAKGRCAPQANG